MEIEEESQDSFYSAVSTFSSTFSTSSFYTANSHLSPTPSISDIDIELPSGPNSAVPLSFSSANSVIPISYAQASYSPSASAPIITSSPYFSAPPSPSQTIQSGAGASHSTPTITLSEVERAGAFKRSLLDIDIKPSSSTNDFRLFLTLLREKLLVLFPRLLVEYHGAKVWLAIQLQYSAVKDMTKTVPGFLPTSSYIIHNEVELENTVDEICKKVYFFKM